MNEKEEIKQLWRECFPDDSEAFIDLYFTYKYTDERNLCIRRDGQVAAALQMLPYQMTFGGGEIATRYLSGCCTAHAWRSQGLMAQLLGQSLQQMAADGVVLAELIPAERSLFDYYARFGFATIFGYEPTLLTDDHQPERSPFQRQKSGQQDLDDPQTQLLLRFADNLLRRRPCCIQHSPADFAAIVRNIGLSGGIINVAQAFVEGKGPRTGMVAMMYPRPGNHWIVDDYFAAVPEIEQPVFDAFCPALKARSIEVRRQPRSLAQMTPLGMGRIVNAFELLKRYAAAHPEADECIILTDPLLDHNSGAYLITDGQCLKSTNPSLNIKNRLMLSIDELALWIFSQEVPYMSMMLNL